MTATTATFLGILASCLIARLTYTGRRKGLKRLLELGTVVLFIATLGSFWWTFEPPSAQNLIGPTQAKNSIVAPGATGPITQNNYQEAIAPNGIASVGGVLINPSVNNYGSPPPHLSYEEKVISQIANKKLLEILVKTDRPIPAAHIGILFSGPFNESKAFFQTHQPTVTNTGGIVGVRYSYPLLHNGTNAPLANSIGVQVDLPSSLDPDQELVLTVETAPDVHVVQIGQYR